MATSPAFASSTSPAPQKRGPETSEDQACACRNAVEQGLRTRRFVLPPGDDSLPRRTVR